VESAVQKVIRTAKLSPPPAGKVYGLFVSVAGGGTFPPSDRTLAQVGLKNMDVVYLKQRTAPSASNTAYAPTLSVSGSIIPPITISAGATKTLPSANANSGSTISSPLSPRASHVPTGPSPPASPRDNTVDQKNEKPAPTSPKGTSSPITSAGTTPPIDWNNRNNRASTAMQTKARTAIGTLRGTITGNRDGNSTTPSESAPPPAFPVEDGHLMLVVECPEHQLTRTVRVAKGENLANLLTHITKKNPIPDIADYAIFLKDNRARGQISKVATIEELGLPSMTRLLLQRVQIVLNIKLPWQEAEITIATEPETFVKDLLKQIIATIKRKRTLEKENEYSLFLCSKVGGEIMLEPKRTVASYRMNSGTQLHFKREEDSVTSKRRSQRLAGLTKGICLTVEAPALGVKKTFQFAHNTSIAEVIKTFTRTCKVADMSNYSLFVPASNGNPERMMEHLLKLSDYNLDNMANLLYKARPDTGGETLTPKPTVEPDKNFGVDPETLPKVDDRSFLVPTVLAQLRQTLYEKEGPQQEGVFRLAGDEMEMLQLKKKLGDGTYEGSNDINTVATLIKRWFGELPVRVFSALPTEEYERCVQNPTACATFPEKLAEPQRTLFLWFAEILVDVARQQSINKMTPGNIAVVTAPVLANISKENPIEGLIITGQVVNIITNFLNARLASSSGKQAGE
jgi:hypothetical protein